MPHVASKIVLPLSQLPAPRVRNLVIVSDSSLNLPGAIYGLQCTAREAQHMSINLLWIAVIPGVGAERFANAWKEPYTVISG